MTRVELLERAVAELTQEEQIDLIGRAWDNLAADPAALDPLTDEERALLDERIAAHDADPSTALSLEEALAAARRRVQRR
ncbi:MAG TPA: addiction module protein [Thermoanaerobaculia bacterium]|jgi:putative addiction module component (TIGR02574 family)|nr:addiction module protein [Thermoanaerobaculia bacterium]